MEARPLIIDCDPGQDDAVALLLALASHELAVLGVTAVAGNVAVERTARNARRVLELAGRGDVPVYAGCPRPILAPPADAAHVHGADGLGGAALHAPAAPVAAEHAVAFLIERLMASDGDVTIAALGPLTNLALAIVAEPRIVPRIREIAVMGGAMGAGNASPVAEFNVYADPHAAAVVIDAGAPLTLIGLDVTRCAAATRERLAAIAGHDGAVARFVAGMLTPQLATRGGDGAILHDPCVIAYLLRPELFETARLHVAVETASPLARGQTVIDRRGVTGAPPNATVALGVDGDALFALLGERLANFDTI